LAKLLDAGLISLERQGRHSYYRLASSAVAAALESLAALSPPRGARHESERVRELRFARSCYKHLAGGLAVQLNHAFLASKLIVAGDSKRISLTPAGSAWCRNLGVRDHAGHACLDWTERRHHIGGPLGVALFTRFNQLGWLVANPKTRAVRVTHNGMRELRQQLGIAIPL
jgi:hypothetical protein